jgi:hypothetical protein
MSFSFVLSFEFLDMEFNGLDLSLLASLTTVVALPPELCLSPELEEFENVKGCDL